MIELSVVVGFTQGNLMCSVGRTYCLIFFLPLFQVPYFNVSLKAVVFGVSVLGSIYALSTIFIQIYEGGKGKNGSTVAVSLFLTFDCMPVDKIILTCT